MHRQTKETGISPKVKAEVMNRDSWDGWCCCILCGKPYPYAQPNAHVVRRSQGGMGIVQNIVTLCHKCHRAFDDGEGLDHVGEGATQETIKEEIISYLQRFYPDWNEDDMKYRKW